MKTTFIPQEKHAKAIGRNLRISRKNAHLVCNVIKKKPLVRAKRLLVDLSEEKRSLHGRHYTKTAKNILQLLESCEKNAEFLGLDAGRLMVHAAASNGSVLRRRRRKGAYGNRMKTTNMEIVLVERGKEGKKGKVVKLTEKNVEKVAKEIAKQAEKKKSAEEKPKNVQEKTKRAEEKNQELEEKKLDAGSDQKPAGEQQ